VDNRRSTTGYVFTLDGGEISWKSSKQSIETSSTMQAKVIAWYEATDQAVWLKNFIPSLKVVHGISKPLTM